MADSNSLQNLNNFTNISNDDQLKNSDCKNMMGRNNDYSDMLKYYTKHTKRVLYLKFIFRCIFLGISICIIVASMIMFRHVLYSAVNGGIDSSKIESMVPLLSSLVSFITVFIVLPKIMTQYLFDKEEEKNMYNLVKQIQEYDQKIRDSIKDSE